MDQRRPVLGGCFEIDDEWLRVVADVDALGGVAGGCFGVGDHDRDGFADEAHAALSEDRSTWIVGAFDARGAGQRREPVVDVGAGEDGLDAHYCLCGLCIDAGDSGAGV